MIQAGPLTTGSEGGTPGLMTTVGRRAGKKS